MIAAAPFGLSHSHSSVCFVSFAYLLSLSCLLAGLAMEVYLFTMTGVFLGNSFIFGAVVSGLLTLVIAFYWFFMQMEYGDEV
jgi:hypothetical protein